MKHLLSLTAAGLVLAACASGSNTDPASEDARHSAYSGPALLLGGDLESRERLKDHLSDAVGRATIELGAGNPSVSSSVTVLPPPLSSQEDRATRLPITFDLTLRNGECFAVRRNDGEEFRLDGVTCIPVTTADSASKA